ncbi:hypothetical protein Cri9333_4945 (plasmid) [Crinalium epipsammum PCC 9333]|uniref:Uncharacterized protein n=1 Tax=Crinalium epipsammum PCC 9333 TaxID=1173022 RepID=K9W699_9CYAN|nr:hypothetical protein [Crinalium epipsammum]AFZ15701.1 hypothetical protein Cri9333_4945 [Crinalium epipsammum PCC 9333]
MTRPSSLFERIIHKKQATKNYSLEFFKLKIVYAIATQAILITATSTNLSEKQGRLRQRDVYWLTIASS